MVLEAVIFDWGGTLTPWHTIDPAACWLATTGDAEQAKALHAAENDIWLTARDHHLSGTLEQVFADAGVEMTAERLSRFFTWWEDHTFTDPAAPATFEALRERGLRIGVLSNTIWPRGEHERIFNRDKIGHLIDGDVYSSEIAWTKPDPRAFTAALEAVGVSDPTRAVFVGDRLFDDIYGAQRIGMRAVLVPHSDIPAWQTTGVEGKPDAVIAALDELVDVIDRWQQD
ncbi:MAG TPA: HAD family hydrolase [Jatrophihabitans sp.]